MLARVVLAHPDRKQAIDLFNRCEGAGSPDLVEDGLQFGRTLGGRHRPLSFMLRLPARKVGRASLDPLTEPDRYVVVSDLVSRDSERELVQLFRVGLETHGVQAQKDKRTG